MENNRIRKMTAVFYNKLNKLLISLHRAFIAGLLFVFMLLPNKNVFGIDNINNFNFDLYSQENGLSNNFIHCIHQDKKGWMWFGTSQGISRFDGYKFTVFKNDPEDSTSLRGNLVRTILEDSKGRLWVGTENGGLNVYNTEKENFIHLYSSGKNKVLNGVSVCAIHEDTEGVKWIGTIDKLYKIDKDDNLIQIKPINRSDFTGYFRVIQSDESGNIWLGTNDGLYFYNKTDNSVKEINLFGKNTVNKEIWEIEVIKNEPIWIGTYSYGMFAVNAFTHEVEHIEIDNSNERSKTVRAIAKDHNGSYWIGTRGGLYIYEKGKGTKAFYYHDEREPKSLVNNSIQYIYHDKTGNVWIGTRNGINFLIEERQNIVGYKSIINDNRYLNNGEIFTFWVDPENNIWVGTESGGINILDRKTGKFRYLVPQPNNPNSLSRNCIKALLDVGDDNLWIGTFLGGVCVLNRETGQFTNYINIPDNPKSLSNNRVWALCKDSSDKIWVGTSAGIDLFEPASQSFIHYNHLVDNSQVNNIMEDSEKTLWICSQEVVLYNQSNQKITRIDEYARHILEDSKGRFWIATVNKGMALFSKEKGIIKYYTEKNGLANNQTLAILEDNENYLWISTTNGLSKFDPETERFHNFSTKNGFQNNQFNYGAAYKTNNGDLIFGGISGFNIFNPSKIKAGDYFAPIVYTDLKIFNRSVKIGNKKSDILTKSISETDKIKLSYDKNSITIDFASFDYSNNMGIQYSYFLDGFDKDWADPSLLRSATYTNLDPGEYTFKVKTVSIDRKEINLGPDLKIIVTPPYWKTWWFRSIMFVVVVGMFYLLFTFLINREKLKNDLLLERMKAKKLNELNMMKLRFYTNISHEIRTPLTLILGPLEKMKNNQISAIDFKAHIGIMHRNASQLHMLINQLLDFRKLESGNLKLNLTQGDCVAFVREIIKSFENFAVEKEIELNFRTLKKEIITSFDSDKLGKILNNLLTNAFKFTPKGGKISVNLSMFFDNEESELLNSSQEKCWIEISVKDTGIGISNNNISKIFTRFFQVDNGSNQTGSGIGLALTRELIKLLNGEINVTSKPGKGSKFTLRIPYIEVASHEKIINADNLVQINENKAHLEENTNTEEAVAGNKIILLIDDNQDVRYFIKSHFINNYQILEASNGIEGWNIALKTIPDVIISDVLMPDMDGFDLCKKIKADERTSHIPLILLTALGSREHEIEGLSHGADDYISKPFDLVIMQTKVENILAARNALRKKYTSEILLQPRNVLVSSPDERFLQKAIEVVENNISNPEMDIEYFASEIGVSRMQLYRKLDALTEMTVKEFVKNIRLKRASQLLLQKKLNVSEIAYSVGFKDLSHFRKSFKQEFGMSATEYIEKNS